MRRLLKVFVAILMVLTLVPTSVLAEETIKIEMLNYTTETEYNSADFYVVYRDDFDSNRYVAEIFNKETDELVQTFSERPDIPLEIAKQISFGEIHTKAISNYDSTWDTTKSLRNIDGYRIDAYVWVRVNITADFSWRQVEKVISMGHSAGGSGYYSLDPGGTFCNTKTFPCSDTLSLQINGMIEISESQSSSAGFSFALLEGLGFQMSGSTSTTWYARSSYNTNVNFTVM